MVAVLTYVANIVALLHVAVTENSLTRLRPVFGWLWLLNGPCLIDEPHQRRFKGLKTYVSNPLIYPLLKPAG